MTNTDDLRILLVRVGPTLWDEAGRLVGATDLPLSPRGLERAKAAAAEASTADVALVMAARDEASQTTAKAIQQAAGGRIRQSPSLAEVDLGLWEGMLKDEFEEKFPTACKQWSEDPANVVAPEGESLMQAGERLLDEIWRTLAKFKASEGAVVVALRPMAYTLIRMAMDDAPNAAFCREMEQGPPTQWKQVARSRLRELRERASTHAMRA